MLRRLSLISAVALMTASCNVGRSVLTRQERLTAEVGARSYAENAEANFVSCFSTDTNSDGWITCMVLPKGGGEPTPIACGYRDGMSGCKRLPPEGHEPAISR